MPCDNTRPCSCPKTQCPNHGRCCACVEQHRKDGKLTSCMRQMLEAQEKENA